MCADPVANSQQQFSNVCMVSDGLLDELGIRYTFMSFEHSCFGIPAYRFNKICHPSQRPRWQVDKEAIGLSRVQKCRIACVCLKWHENIFKTASSADLAYCKSGSLPIFVQIIERIYFSC